MPPRAVVRRLLGERIQQLTALAMGDGIPCVPSPQEVETMRNETLSHIRHIQMLDESKNSGRAPPNIDEALIFARARYHTYFPRIFRVNDLPTEILANIFRYIVWPVPNPGTGTLWRLWLTWTCRRWRQIAAGDPTLWNAIWFRDRPPFARSWAFLERAGPSSLLDLRISSEDTTPISVPEMDSLLDRIIPLIPRIRILIYIGSSWQHIELLLNKLGTVQLAGVPLALERLEIHRLGYIDYNHQGNIKPTVLFNGALAPRLQYLSLSGVHIDWNTPVLHNLSTIDIRKLPLELSPSIARFREILTNCPSLRKLCLDGAGPQFDFHDPSPTPIVLKNMKILCISDFSAHYARHVFSHFMAPNLIDLTFINMTGEDYSPLYEILINRFPQIKLLTMYAIDMVPRSKTMTEWLMSMPQLSYLRVANLPVSFFDLFTLDPRKVLAPEKEHPSPAKVLAPKLDIIESHPSVVPALVKLVDDRRSLGFPIERVYITRTKELTSNKPLQEACTQLMKSTTVQFMFSGTRTPEEDAILGE
ncbi:hypothetical protein H0H93_004953 [Arthromyces matolae]|nr:hypothetical protein H0H93_004953 [Arthromyces matolae]